MLCRHGNCCYQAGFGGVGFGGGYGGGYPAYGAGYGTGYEGWGIRWIYALLVLIVIVLQFGRVNRREAVVKSPCDDVAVVTTGDGFLSNNGLFDNQLIDNSVLFIIVVFLLILCAGCWTGGYGNYGTAGGGYGGYGY